jgi:hypothetical protein
MCKATSSITFVYYFLGLDGYAQVQMKSSWFVYNSKVFFKVEQLNRSSPGPCTIGIAIVVTVGIVGRGTFAK